MRRWLRRGLQAMTFLFSRCRDVLIEDVTLVGSTLWNVRLWGCDGVVIRGVTIESDLERAANSDGVDIDGSRNVRISDCRITTADDAIVLKSGKWRWDGRGESFPTENVVVTNCVLSSSSSAFTIGTESYEDFRHIVLSNSVIRDSNRAFGINIQDGATVEDVLIANVTVDLRRRHWNWWGNAELLHFVLKKRTPESRLGAVRNVVVKDVVAHVQGTARIVGHAERPLEDVTLVRHPALHGSRSRRPTSAPPTPSWPRVSTGCGSATSSCAGPRTPRSRDGRAPSSSGRPATSSCPASSGAPRRAATSRPW